MTWSWLIEAHIMLPNGLFALFAKQFISAFILNAIFHTQVTTQLSFSSQNY